MLVPKTNKAGIEVMEKHVQRLVVQVINVLICGLALSISLLTSGKLAANEITNVSFQLNDQRQGVLMIALSEQGSAVDVSDGDNGLNIMLRQTKVTPEHLSIYDVTDFATPVTTIELFDESPHVRLAIKTKQPVDYQYVVADNQLRVTFVELTQLAPTKKRWSRAIKAN